MADYKSTHTGAEIDAGIDKAVTAESNWSLLMANLGIGRWANQTFYNFAWETPVIYDSVLKDYTNYARCFAHLSYNNFNGGLQTKAITFNKDTYFTFGTSQYHVVNASLCFYDLKNASSLTIRINKDAPHVSCNGFCTNANITAFDVVDQDGNPTYIVPNYIEDGFNNCVNITSIKGIDFSKNTNNFYSSLFYNTPKLTNIECKGLSTSFNIRTTGITTSEQLQSVINSMTNPKTSGMTININSTQNSAMTDTQRTYLTDTLGWSIAVA